MRTLSALFVACCTFCADTAIAASNPVLRTHPAELAIPEASSWGNDKVGIVVALANGRAGAVWRNYGSSGLNSAVPIFKRSAAATWSLEKTLFPCDPSGGNIESLAMDGSNIVYGDISVNQGSSLQVGGACRLPNNGSYPAATKIAPVGGIDPNNPLSNMAFGKSLTVDGNVLVVGSPLDDTASVDVGTVRVFQNGGGAWNATDTFTFNVAANSRMGDRGTVASASGLIGVGWPAGNRVVWYQLSGATWIKQAHLLSPGEAGARFGEAIALTPNYLLVGAPLEKASKGKAYLFQLTNATWTLIQSFDYPGQKAWARFGAAVSITEGGGDVSFAIAAPEGDWEASAAYACSGSGAVYVYTKSKLDSQFRLADILSQPDPDNCDHFGFSVDLDGQTVLVSAPLDEVGSKLARGTLWVFDYPLFRDGLED